MLNWKQLYRFGMNKILKRSTSTSICHHVIYLLAFETFALLVTVTGQPGFAASLTDSVWVRFFSPSTNCLIKYLIRPSLKICITKITEFWANFLNTLSLFPRQPFLQRWSTKSSIEMTISLNLEAHVLMLFVRYWIELFKSIIIYDIVLSFIALCDKAHVEQPLH